MPIAVTQARIFNPATPLLRWNPAVVCPLTTPTTINVSSATPDNTNLTANTDYIINFTGAGNKRMRFTGGRNIRIIGGEIDVAVDQATAATDAGNTPNCGLEFNSGTGVVYIEGVRVHGAYALDSIRYSTGTPNGAATFYVQNCRLECQRLASLGTDTFHSDGFQCWSGVQALNMNKVTIYNPYQGGMWGDGALQTDWGPTILDRVNFRADTAAGQAWKLLNFVQTSSGSGVLVGPITFKDVFYELGPGFTWDAAAGTTTNGVKSNAGGFWTQWAYGTDSAGRVYAEALASLAKPTAGTSDGGSALGRVYRGVPVAGDYCTTAGLSYTSPGYL